MKVTVVIPNYNGIEYVEDCLNSLKNQDYQDFGIFVIDNGSQDGSFELIKEKYPEVETFRFSENQGFCKAVNTGIEKSDSEYVLLLNNDTVAKSEFIRYLVEAIETSPRIFSVSAKMVMMQNPELIDDAGDLYCALGWAFARGKEKPLDKFDKKEEIFSACGGAAIYRREILKEIGVFDETHFAYLEDLDIGYRAKIFGYKNLYEPRAVVLHKGSAVSGSRYNEFKVTLSSVNSVYVIAKNMPLLQILLNLPFLVVGFGIKNLFFIKKGLGILYIKGLMKGIKLSFSKAGRAKKVVFKTSHFGNYVRIQLELWINTLRRFL